MSVIQSKMCSNLQINGKLQNKIPSVELSMTGRINSAANAKLPICQALSSASGR